MGQYMVDVSWRVSGRVYVDAENEEEARRLALDAPVDTANQEHGPVQVDEVNDETMVEPDNKKPMEPK